MQRIPRLFSSAPARRLARAPARAAACLLLSSLAAPLPGEGRASDDFWEKGAPIQLATSPALSPDGKSLAFGWAGDIWTARSSGGAAKRLTSHPSQESGPAYSPDGQRIAFTSNRTGQDQAWIMPAGGGVPRQFTFHSEGARVVEWYPDGQSLLVEGTRDFATRSASRFYRVDLEERRPEALLFNAEGHSAALSPCGTKLLFCRETDDLYRRGYRGTRSSQIWLAERLETSKPKFTRLIARQTGARSPLWKPDGSGFYYLGDHGPGGLFDLWERDLESGDETRLTDLRDDPAILPGISRDGSVMVFRKGFAFHRLLLSGDNVPKRARALSLRAAGDTLPDFTVRRSLTKADNLSFSADGLEVAFASGGDLWVMDTELREPVPVTRTPDEEREPVFSTDGRTLFFIRDSGAGADIWAVEQEDPAEYWWRGPAFIERQITRDGAAKEDLQMVPGDERISWISGIGDLWTARRDGSGARRLLESWNRPDYDWSPDGQWIAWAVSDNDFNRDVWIGRADGEPEPYNLSRHPDNDGNPSWSPDGKILAFTGRRHDKEVDIHYVYLNLADEEKDRRTRTLESALEKMEKLRKKPVPASPAPARPASPAPAQATDQSDEPTDPAPSPAPPPAAAAAAAPAAPAPAASAAAQAKLPEVTIDFEGLAERVKRLSIAGSAESGLFWSHDGKRLAFSSEIRGAKGTYTVTFPDRLTPALLHAKQGSLARWIARDDTVLWLVDGLPAALSKGNLASYAFTARQSHDRRDYWRVAFRQVWRRMGEVWYDEALNHLDWEAMREKYEDAAASAADPAAFDRAVAMMLGELNGSHLGFRSDDAAPGWRPPSGWNEVTGHLGASFDLAFPGPGLKVATVIPKGPADRTGSRLIPGDIILEIDGQPVDRSIDLPSVLNGILPRDVRLTLAGEETPAEGAAREAQEAPEETVDAGETAEDGDEPGEEIEDRDKIAEGEIGGEVREEPEEKAESAPPAARHLVVRPVTYAAARSLLQEARVEEVRALVDRLSEGRLGYVLVPKMDWGEFVKFQEELFARGAGKEGLLIDVRDNGGGFTADHLLTALTPAEHAITVPRGGGPGYPQDRRVYATWNKPVAVLCNQNSFSNAEIFSHAIKELGRGKLVGVATAGGVVSTGTARVMDIGTLRIPFRGWFRKSDGADMELNGAVPDIRAWPHPADTASRRDRQIEKAVAALLEEVASSQSQPAPRLIPASARE